MSNKINKYSWIHQLNQAALETKLLSEAKLFEQQMNPFESSISKAGGDIDVYRQILDKKRKDIKPSDVDGNGVVNGKDVENDVKNNVVGDEDGDEDGSAVDPSMMAQYPSLQRGMRMGSRDPDAIINNLYSGIDDAIDRRNRSAPSATRYDVADLQRMARLLGNQ